MHDAVFVYPLVDRLLRVGGDCYGENYSKQDQYSYRSPS